MTIAEQIRLRKIEKLIHFTTNRGLVGVLATKKLLPRRLLGAEQMLEHVLQVNCCTRRDTNWDGHTSLSISVPNRFFLKAAMRWHPDCWWCAIALDPNLMCDPDVVFSTTNNIYTGVKRGKDLPGFEALFEMAVNQYLNRWVRRSPTLPAWQPTDEQAEVLYPGKIDLSRAFAIYVADDETASKAEAAVETLGASRLQVSVVPDFFPDGAE